jgi:hypothetical protein
MPPSTPLDAMRTVARRLAPLNIRYAFLGGAIVPLLLDHPALIDFRPTKDVDAVVRILEMAAYNELEGHLKQAGFRNASEEIDRDAPLFRWEIDGCLLDLMPSSPDVLKLPSRWFTDALDHSIPRDLGEGVSAHVITAPYFIAMKLAAFQDRGEGDHQASHDLEDIVTLIDGRAGIAAEIEKCDPSLRQFLAISIRELLSDRRFLEALPGHFPSDSVSIASFRERITRERMLAIATLAGKPSDSSREL